MAKINTIFSLTDNVSSPMMKISDSIGNATRGFESMEGKLVTLNAGLNLLQQAVGLVSNVGSVFGKMVSDAGEYESYMARLTVATGDAVSAQEEFQRFKEFASVSPFDLPGVVEAGIMFRNAGVEAEKLIPTIQMLGDVAQGNNDYFNRMAVNFMQIKSAGKATATDLNQFALMGVPIKQVLKDMGVTGTATAQDVENAFKIMTSAGGQFYNSMSSNANTFSGRTANLGDVVQQLSATIGNTMLPTIKELMMAWAGFLESLEDTVAFQWVISTMQKFANSFKENVNEMITMALYLGTVVFIVATKMAVAWAIANWPITLTITLIGVLVSMFLEVFDNANKASEAMTGFGNSSAKAGELLGRVVGFVVGVVKGLFNIIYNVIATVYNAIQTVIEFLANLFTNPVQAIANLFLNLATTIVNVLETIASAIDLVIGTNIQQALTKASLAIQQFKKENFINEGYKTSFAGEAGLFQLREVQGMFDVSANMGNALNEIFGLFDKNFTFNELENLLPPPESGEQFKFDSSGALVVADKNTISLADDFRELLSKQATERFNLQMSQVTPSVNVGGITVNNNADLDSIMDRLIAGAEEATSASLRSN